MNTMTITKLKWTNSDLQFLPENSNRYEIIDGELEMTPTPHWKNQDTIAAIVK